MGAIILRAIGGGKSLGRLQVDFGGKVAVSPYEKIIAISDDGLIRLHRLTDLSEVVQFQVSESSISDFCFISQGDRLVASDHIDETIQIWDIHSRKAVVSIADSGEVVCFSVSPDETMVVAGTVEGTLGAWSLAGKLLIRLPDAHGERISAVAFSSDGRKFATAALDGGVAIWNSQSFEPVRIAAGSGRLIGSVFALAFSPDMRLLACAYDSGIIKVWDAVTRHELGAIRVPGMATAIAFSKAGKIIAGGGSVGRIGMWNNDFSPSR
jgi:WD40 repeat protein